MSIFCLLPVGQDAEHPLCGGEGAVGGEEDGDEGGVPHGEGMQQVKHQLLLRARLHAARTQPGDLPQQKDQKHREA